MQLRILKELRREIAELRILKDLADGGPWGGRRGDVGQEASKRYSIKLVISQAIL